MDMGAPLQIAIGVVGTVMVAAWLVLAFLRNWQAGLPAQDTAFDETRIAPTASADGWMEIWGIGDERAWYENALHLTPGRYRLERTAENITRIDSRGSSYSFSIERLSDDLTPNVWSIGIQEVSNGVYTVIYKPYTTENQQEAKTS